MRNKTQFISIFLMSLLGMFVFVGVDAESSGAAKAANAYYEQYNLCDLWVQGAGFSDDDVRTAMKVGGVENVEKRLAITGTAEKYNNAYMHINFMNTNDINSLMLYSGQPYEDEAEGVWLEEWFARSNNIGIGDTFTMKIDSMKIDAVVKGIVDAPDYVYFVSETDVMYPNYTKCGAAFMSSSMYPDPANIPYNMLLIDLRDDITDPEKVSAVKEKIENGEAIEKPIALSLKDAD